MNHRTYLVLNNPKPTNNLGPLLRCAAAFAISEVVLVGYQKCNTEGAHGSDKHLHISSVTTWDHALEYIRIHSHVHNHLERTTVDVHVIGILGNVFDYGVRKLKIKSSDNSSDDVYEQLNNTTDSNEQAQEKESFPVNAYTRPFSKISKNATTVFMVLDNLESIQNQYLASHVCTLLVHVSHFSLSVSNPEMKSISLIDTQSRLSIVLDHFNSYMEIKEQSSKGFKFDVRIKAHAPGMVDENDQQIAIQRGEIRRQNERKADDIFDSNDRDENWSNSLFGDE